MAGCVRAMRPATALPLIAHANAGQPEVTPEGGLRYAQSIEDYVRFVPEIVEAGAVFVGGCCGTTPDYIRAMARVIRQEVKA